MRAAQEPGESFLLTKEHGISFCILTRQRWLRASSAMARAWAVIPAERCSDTCGGHFPVCHTLSSLFVLMFIALPLKVRNTDFDSHD